VEDEFDIVAAFGGKPLGDRFAVYVPNKDRDGSSVDQKPWVDEALRLLSSVGGGATAMPPVTGAWLNPETQELIIENPVVVYSYVMPDVFLSRLPELIDFVKRLGKRTNQGEIALEYQGTLFTIDDVE
jgi:hypothetical protein